MIKKLLIALALFILVIAGSIGYVFYNLNGIIASFKPSAEQKVSQILGTTFSLGELKVNLFPSTQVSVDTISLGKTDKETGFHLKNIFLDVNLTKLLSKELEISRLLVSKPEITFIRDAKGVRIEGLPQKNTSKSPATTSSSSSNNKATNTTVAAPMPMSLKSLEIQEAQVTLDDQVSGKKYYLRPITVKLALSIDGTVLTLSSLEVAGKVLDVLPFNIKARDLSFDQASGKAKIVEILSSLFSAEFSFNGEIDSKAFAGDFALKTKQALNLASLSSLYSLLPEDKQKLVQSFNLSGSLAPELSTTFKLPAVVSAKGGLALNGIAAKIALFALSGLTGNINLQADLGTQSLESKNLAFSLNGAPIAVEFTSSLSNFTQAQLNQLVIKAFGGTISVTAKAELAPKLPYSTDIQITGIKISDALNVVSATAAQLIDGTVKSIAIKGFGTVDQVPAKELQASGIAQIINARLIGINIAGMVLKTVDNLPLFNMSLYSMIPESERAVYDAQDTSLDAIDAQYTLKDGILNLQRLFLNGPLFSLTGSGTASLALAVDMKAVITFNTSVTSLLLRTNPAINTILDARGQLVLPLSISGTAPKLIIIPDVSKIAGLAAEKIVKQQGQKLVDKALEKAGVKGLSSVLGF